MHFPGLIDIHVHLRDPGQTHKEDFYSGTAAALAGGFTTVFDMPNNTTPITTRKLLEEKMEIASKKTVSQIGFYFGSLGDNLEEFDKVMGLAWGLKLYLNLTTGGFIINEESMVRIYSAWKSKQPILLHSEEDMIDMVLKAVRRTGVKSHFCHVSSKNELSQIIKAKKEGLPVSCGVCAHHLYLTEDDVKNLGSYGLMKPPLKTKKDVEFIWKNLNLVDCIESDHAPHTKPEKDSDEPPFGVPGLETTLPLLLTSASKGKIDAKDIIRLCYEGPKEILGISKGDNARVLVDPNESYEIRNEDLKSKCGWTPFHGWKVKGRVKSVILRGEKVYEDGKVLLSAGAGKVILPQ